jgi:hypothetical protein
VLTGFRQFDMEPLLRIRDADTVQPTPRPQLRLLSERTGFWFSFLGRESRAEVLSGPLKARTQGHSQEPQKHCIESGGL